MLPLFWQFNGPQARAQMEAEKGPEYYQQDARNIVRGMAFVAFLPTFMLLVMMLSGTGGKILWDGVTIGIMTYSVVLALFSIVAGILCGKGKKIGRFLAFVPAVLLVLNFPLGTIFSVATLIKINKREFTETLR